MQIAAQLRTYTFASVSSYLDGAGHAKINLNPADWVQCEDREKFFDDSAGDCDQRSVRTGTARGSSIASASEGDFVVSHIAATGAADRLQRHFGCPVIDIYSMNETGPIAYARADSNADEHEILPHNLFVEILDESGQPVPPGERGEIVVTGGVNPFLPLVRYRTGDFGTLSFREEIPRLVGIERRKPVVFQAADGAQVVSISVTVALFRIPLPLFALHQARDGALLFRTRCDEAAEHDVRQALMGVFGAVPLRFEQVPWEAAWSGKSIQYSRDAEGMP